MHKIIKCDKSLVHPVLAHCLTVYIFISEITPESIFFIEVSVTTIIIKQNRYDMKISEVKKIS